MIEAGSAIELGDDRRKLHAEPPFVRPAARGAERLLPPRPPAGDESSEWFDDEHAVATRGPFEEPAKQRLSRIFVQLSDFHGFAIVDFATHKETGRVTLPDVPGATKGLNIQGSPSHGIGIAPDHKTLWVNSKWYHYVAAYSMPDLKLLGIVPVGHYPDWLTFSPDSTHVYVACAGANSVSVIDVKSLKEIAKIPVGEAPKRNITAVLQ